MMRTYSVPDPDHEPPIFEQRMGGYNVINSPGPYAAHVYRHCDGRWAVVDGWGTEWPKRYATRKQAAWYVMVLTDNPFGAMVSA